MRLPTTDAALESIEQWLLNSPIQIREGEEAGGVAGWLAQQGPPEFIYMEITGYYLSWLAFLMSRGRVKTPDVLRPAALAVDWLERNTVDGKLPPTRRYLQAPRAVDWRTQAVFAFDLGMVVRGLTALHRQAPGLVSTRLLTLFVRLLLDLRNEHQGFRSHLFLDHVCRDDFPDKWSTRPGAFHLKVAAGILALAKAGVDVGTAGLEAVARCEYARWREAAVGPPLMTELHPYFYGLEGLCTFAVLDDDPAALTAIECALLRVLVHQQADGLLPAVVGVAPAEYRSDVLAQALRLGAWLLRLGYLRGQDEHGVAWSRRLDQLASALLRFVEPGGGVAFGGPAQATHGHQNAWAAMFTHQALTLHSDPTVPALHAWSSALLV